jgi:hypothetical protein
MKNIFKISLLCIGLTVYGLIFIEVFLRLFAPQAIMPRHVVGSDYGVRMNEPGAIYRQKTAETSAIIRINGLGLRGPREQSLEKPDGVKRIVLFGDSYFMGYEADYADSLAARLGNEMRQRQCEVEIINLAVSGFGTAEMLRTLEARGADFAPDVVLFQWHHTDPADNKRSGLYRVDDGILVSTGKNYLPANDMRKRLQQQPAYRLVSEHSHAYAALREKTATTIKNLMTGGALVKRPGQVASLVVAGDKVVSSAVSQDRDDRPPATALDLALLDAAEQRSLDAGAGFYVVDIPSWHTRTQFSSGFRLLPEQRRQRENYLSPITRFRKEADATRKIYWEKGHMHLTPYGNQLLAEEIARKLTNNPQRQAQLSCGPKSDALAANAPNR